MHALNFAWCKDQGWFGGDWETSGPGKTEGDPASPPRTPACQHMHKGGGGSLLWPAEPLVHPCPASLTRTSPQPQFPFLTWTGQDQMFTFPCDRPELKGVLHCGDRTR
jgi:hypothetical protein